VTRLETVKINVGGKSVVWTFDTLGTAPFPLSKIVSGAEGITPPPTDGSDSADTALRCLYPEDKGRILDFKDERNLSACFADLLSVRQSIAEHEKLEAQLKQRLNLNNRFHPL
jgi:hypothetical protein